MPPLARQLCRKERGAALLVAIVAIAILTTLAADLAYDTQVRLRIAANARDNLRASALAQSAVNLSRLVLGFQAELDQSLQAACGLTSAQSTSTQGATTASSTASAALASATQGACPRPQLWSIIPVSSALTQALFGDGEVKDSAAASKKGPREGVQSFTYGDFEGGFSAQIEDEGEKTNVQLDALQTGGMLGPQVEALLKMDCDSKWDPLFDRTDDEGQRYSRSDLIVNLRDWVDENGVTSTLNVSFPGGNCSYLVPQNPFEEGFGDENFPYDRGSDRYKAKNARMDSLDELYLVAGVTDAFMAAFGDELTVYLPNGAGLNVNSDDPAQQLRIAGLMADPTSLTQLLDPAFQAAFKKALSQVRMGGFLSITPVQFAQILQGLSVKVRTEYLTQNPKNPFTDRSVVYRIRGLGVAGDVTHETLAVVSFDPSIQNSTQTATGQTTTSGTSSTQTASSQPAAALLQALGAANATTPPFGRLIHWHEE